MNSKRNLPKLGRTKSHREAMLSNLLGSLVVYENIQTTLPKAKAIVGTFDKLITIALKEEAVVARQKLSTYLYDENAIEKVLTVYRKRFSGEKGSYLSIYKTGLRKGDGAQMVKLLVKGYVYKEVGKKTKKSQKKESTQVKNRSVVSQVSADSNKSQVKGAAQQSKAKSRSGI